LEAKAAERRRELLAKEDEHEKLAAERQRKFEAKGVAFEVACHDHPPANTVAMRTRGTSAKAQPEPGRRNAQNQAAEHSRELVANEEEHIRKSEANAAERSRELVEKEQEVAFEVACHDHPVATRTRGTSTKARSLMLAPGRRVVMRP
jgi:hypothetical protein